MNIVKGTSKTSLPISSTTTYGKCIGFKAVILASRAQGSRKWTQGEFGCFWPLLEMCSSICSSMTEVTSCSFFTSQILKLSHLTVTSINRLLKSK